LQQTQATLAASAAEAAQANAVKDQQQQRANQLQAQLIQRNQQLATTLQSLATSLDIGERPAPLTEDLQADAVWQQHTRVVNQLVTTLRSETAAKNEWKSSSQNESSKRAELAAQVLPLQTSLSEQTQRIEALLTQLNEQAAAFDSLQQKYAEQQSLQKQSEEDAFAQLLAGHQADAEHLQTLERQVTDTAAQLKHLQEALTSKEVLIARLEAQLADALTVKPQVAAIVEPTVVDTVTHNLPPRTTDAPATKPHEETSKPSEDRPRNAPLGVLKGLFGKTAPVAEQAPEAATLVVAAPEPKLEKTEQAVVEAELAEEMPKSKALGFMKSIFANAKSLEPKDEVVEPEAVSEPITEEQPSVVETEVAEPAAKPTGLSFMKNLFSKKPVPEPEPQQAHEPEVVEEPVPVGMAFMKNIFAKNTKAAEPQPLVVEPEITQPTPEHKAFGFMKKLLAKKEVVEIVIEPEQPSVEDEKPANLTGQFKGFYRKFSSKN
jgi:hypothetical protein